MSDRSQEHLSTYLNSESTSAGCLDFVACHGFLTAIVVRDDEYDTDQLLRVILDGEPRYQSRDEQEAVESALKEQLTALSRQLYLGDAVQFPHDLRPPKLNQTNDLTDWCFGFMEAVAAYEDHWFASSFAIEAVAEFILPISVFSEPHVEPGLAHLVKTDKARYALASEIPDNLQQLYLLFRD